MDAGVWVVILAAAVALVTAFLLRARLPALAVAALLAASGAGLGVGGMLLRDDPTSAELTGAVVGLALLVPAHVRVVLGRFGRAARGRGIRAMADPHGPPR